MFCDHNQIGGTRMKTRITGGTIAVLAGVMLCGSATLAAEMKPALTLEMAKKMAAACETKATQEKWSTTAQTWFSSSTWTMHSKAASTSHSTRQ
jgi:hypothetical protein